MHRKKNTITQLGLKWRLVRNYKITINDVFSVLKIVRLSICCIVNSWCILSHLCVLMGHLSICCIILQMNSWCIFSCLCVLMGDLSICFIVLQRNRWSNGCIHLRYFIIHRRIFLGLITPGPETSPHRDTIIYIKTYYYTLTIHDFHMQGYHSTTEWDLEYQLIVTWTITWAFTAAA